jgi:predicted SprT family Zn-dependent metalloprotease
MELGVAERLARSLMQEHLGQGATSWTFRFDGGKRRFGCCSFTNSEIRLSRHLTVLNGHDEVQNTILHEIAHAIAGPGVGHGPAWKRIARQIGARPERCFDSTTTEMPKGNYALVCLNCGMRSDRFRKTSTNKACAICCRKHSFGRYDARFKLVWEDSMPKPERVAASTAAPSSKTLTKASGNLCRGCGVAIPPSGKRGRPAVYHSWCRS